jgi:hypothetical protein
MREKVLQSSLRLNSSFSVWRLSSKTDKLKDLQNKKSRQAKNELLALAKIVRGV